MLTTIVNQTVLTAELCQIEILCVARKSGLMRLQSAEMAGCKFSWARDLAEASKSWRGKHFQMLLLDVGFLHGEEAKKLSLLQTQIEQSRAAFVVFGENADDKARRAAFETGAHDFIALDWTTPEIAWRLKFQQQNHERARRQRDNLRRSDFLAELGKSLLVTLDPEQVVSHLAGAVYEATDAVLCAAAAAVSGSTPTIAAFNRDGAAEGADEINLERLQKWLRSEVGREAKLLTDARDFLLLDDVHNCEYVAPLNVGDRTKGLIVVGFDCIADFTPEIGELVSAAADFTAPSVHVTSLYDAALNASIYLVKEEQKRFTEAILDALPVSLYAVDRDFRIVTWNRQRELGTQGLPRETVMGRNVFDVLIRQPREKLEREFARAFATGQIERVEQKTVDENGAAKHWLISKIPMRHQDSGEVTHVINLGEDITARVEANHHVARAEKLAAVGRLAAGIVHEINNPLATIAACAEALESRANENAFGANEDVDDLHDYLNLIRSEAFRCKSITNGLLDFSRVRSGHRSSLDLAEVVRSAANLVAHQKRGENDIEIAVEADESLPRVSADEGQIQQAVIALATNAIDAMPSGGKLTFSVYAKRQRLLLEIADTGIGIPSENMTKIFEPFFTTKEVGRGTGLGLAVCYGIVTEHGGSLNVRSTPNIGTTFTISLPVER